MTLRLALIGDPVAHSRSPALQRAFLAAAGIEGTYDLIRTATGEAARTIDALRTQGYHGLNVTTPLKEEAFARADWRDANALASGAVNTLVLGETIEGHNTDGIGALGALADAGLCDVAGARILVLGARVAVGHHYLQVGAGFGKRPECTGQHRAGSARRPRNRRHDSRDRHHGRLAFRRQHDARGRI